MTREPFREHGQRARRPQFAEGAEQGRAILRVFADDNRPRAMRPVIKMRFDH